MGNETHLWDPKEIQPKKKCFPSPSLGFNSFLFLFCFWGKLGCNTLLSLITQKKKKNSQEPRSKGERNRLKIKGHLLNTAEEMEPISHGPKKEIVTETLE